MARHTTSSKEVLDLLIAWLGVSFAFYLALFRPNLSHVSLEIVLPNLIITLAVVGSSFVLHELLHKFTAQHFGFWSEFRASYTMLAFAVLFAAISGIVFAAPGATMIYGPTITKRQNGIISAAGPLLNLALGGLFLLLYLLTPLGSVLNEVGQLGFIINVWLSAFNLLPIGPLDGKKVLDWGVPQYIAIATVPFLGAIFVFFGGFL
ncbi:MAG TPA: peptidase M50 [archaeon]